MAIRLTILWKVISSATSGTERALAQWTYVMSLIKSPLGIQNILVARLNSYPLWRFGALQMQVGKSHKNYKKNESGSVNSSDFKKMFSDVCKDFVTDKWNIEVGLSFNKISKQLLHET